MLLYDLLKTADIRQIINEDPIKTFDVVQEDKRYKVYKTFVEKLLSKEVFSIPGILLGCERYDAIEHEMTMDMGVYYRDEIESKLHNISTVCNTKPAKEMTGEEIEAFLEMVKQEDFNDSFLPSGYAFEFTEWEEILGWDVDQVNIDSVGVNRFLSYVLFEMSFNGFEEPSQEERRKELESRIEEYEEIKKLPVEEQEKHFVSVNVEDMFKELSEKYGVELPKKTEEEKEKERRELNYSIVLNLQNEAHMLMDFFKRRM